MSKNKKPIPKRPGYKKATVLTPKQIAFVEEKAGRNSLVQIAHMLGMGETTIHTIKNRQPEVNEAYAYARVRARAVDLVASVIFNAAIQGDRVVFI